LEKRSSLLRFESKNIFVYFGKTLWPSYKLKKSQDWHQADSGSLFAKQKKDKRRRKAISPAKLFIASSPSIKLEKKTSSG
jgi:hypothetical protein